MMELPLACKLTDVPGTRAFLESLGLADDGR